MVNKLVISGSIARTIRKMNFAKYASAMKDGNNDIVSFVVKNSFADQGFSGSSCSQTT